VHPFAHVVVGFPDQGQGHARQVEGPEALAGAALKGQVELAFKARVAVFLGDDSSDPCSKVRSVVTTW
jgi:hypothetical protein